MHSSQRLAWQEICKDCKGKATESRKRNQKRLWIETVMRSTHRDDGRERRRTPPCRGKGGLFLFLVLWLFSCIGDEECLGPSSVSKDTTQRRRERQKKNTTQCRGRRWLLLFIFPFADEEGFGPSLPNRKNHKQGEKTLQTWCSEHVASFCLCDGRCPRSVHVLESLFCDHWTNPKNTETWRKCHFVQNGVLDEQHKRKAKKKHKPKKQKLKQSKQNRNKSNTKNKNKHKKHRNTYTFQTQHKEE